MADRIDWFCTPVMIMSEDLGLKIPSYVLLLNTVTIMLKLSII